MPRLTLVLFTFLAFCAGLNAQAAIEVRGRVFYDKLDSKEPSFFFLSTDETKDGQRVVTTVYSDKEGKELVREENTFAGGKLLRSKYSQNQVNEHGEVTFKDGKALFTFTDGKGTESESEDIVPDMILGSMIGDHLINHWDELVKGESVHVRYMAIERCETVGFKFFKSAERNVGGKPVFEFTMKPSSFIISAIVDPIRISVTKDEPHRIVEVEGRTPIRWPKVQPPQSRKDWKAIDGRIEMDPPRALEAPAQPAPEPAAPVIPAAVKKPANKPAPKKR
jgi:hypothetical protein